MALTFTKTFKNIIVEVLHGIISNGRHFCQIQYGGWQPSWICWLQRPPINIKMSPSYSAWSKTPIYTYYMAIQIHLYVSDSFSPIPFKIGPPLGPYLGPNYPRGGIFALGNMCFHKPGSDRDLWVPLKFCHQGDARGPLLPTRLYELEPNFEHEPQSLKATRPPAIMPSVLATRPWPIHQKLAVQHVSVHWQQGTCQSWANCFMCLFPFFPINFLFKELVCTKYFVLPYFIIFHKSSPFLIQLEVLFLTATIWSFRPYCYRIYFMHDHKLRQELSNGFSFKLWVFADICLFREILIKAKFV